MRRGGIADKELVIDILSKAFDKNQSVNLLVQQDVQRTERIRKLMAYSFDTCFLHGELFLSEDRKACALILLPDKRKTTIRSLILDLQLIMTVTGWRHLKAALNRESKIRKIHPEGRLYYLWFIGVEPASQGNGIGSRLLSAVIETGLAQKRTICLETSTLQNLPWYKKHGFELYRELDFGYSLYCLKKT